MNIDKTIILIVGASGVGKDSLMKKTQEVFSECNFVRRYITRQPDEHENNYFISEHKFHKLQSEDFFICTWAAHGNYYGIAKEEIKGGVNFISISRKAIKDFEKVYKRVVTIHVRVSRYELENRLRARGRESEGEIQKRLARSYKNIESKELFEFDNSATIHKSEEQFIELLEKIIFKKEQVC